MTGMKWVQKKHKKIMEINGEGELEATSNRNFCQEILDL